MRATRGCSRRPRPPLLAQAVHVLQQEAGQRGGTPAERPGLGAQSLGRDGAGRGEQAVEQAEGGGLTNMPQGGEQVGGLMGGGESVEVGRRGTGWGEVGAKGSPPEATQPPPPPPPGCCLHRHTPPPPPPSPFTWQGEPCPVASMRKRKCSSQVRQNSMSGSGLCARTSSRNAGMKYRACGTAGSGAS